MKCIQLKNGDMDRVSNSVAQTLVNRGEAAYVSKLLWRKAKVESALKEDAELNRLAEKRSKSGRTIPVQLQDL